MTDQSRRILNSALKRLTIFAGDSHISTMKSGDMAGLGEIKRAIFLEFNKEILTFFGQTPLRGLSV